MKRENRRWQIVMLAFISVHDSFTTQVFVQCNDRGLHSKPSLKFATQRNGHYYEMADTNMMRIRAVPDVVVITRWCQCQPLGQTAALAMWISQIKPGSNLLWSVRGNTWWWGRDKQLQSETAQLIQAAVRSNTKSHHRKCCKCRVMNNVFLVNFSCM